MALVAGMVPHLARAIAPNCEVVLHDNRVAPPVIRAIGNGHVTGRGPGDLMTQISIGGCETRNIRQALFNYPSETPDGIKLRVSVIPIVHRRETIGYLAINFATSELDRAKQAIAFLTATEEHDQEIRETFTPAVDVIDEVFNKCLHRIGRSAEGLDRKGRIELVRRLQERGVFALRGAPARVASKLNVSRAAVYNYLRLANEGIRAQVE